LDDSGSSGSEVRVSVRISEGRITAESFVRVGRRQVVVSDDGLSLVWGSDWNGNGNALVLVFVLLDGHFWLDGLGHFRCSVANLQFTTVKTLVTLLHIASFSR